MAVSDVTSASDIVLGGLVSSCVQTEAVVLGISVHQLLWGAGAVGCI